MVSIYGGIRTMCKFGGICMLHIILVSNTNP